MYALQFAAVGLHGDERRRDEKFLPERSPRVHRLWRRNFERTKPEPIPANFAGAGQLLARHDLLGMQQTKQSVDGELGSAAELSRDGAAGDRR
jgi:hypothetical protein